MRRKLFTLCSAVSLLLCAAVCVLWVRSQFAQEVASFELASGRRIMLGWGDGQFLIDCRLGTAVKPLPGNEGWRWKSGQPTRLYPNSAYVYRPEYVRLVLIGPFWIPALVTGAGPLFYIGWRIARRSRSKAGHCAHCGYDLRATPGRCPECGTEPPPVRAR
jgi:hypothetical protein